MATLSRPALRSCRLVTPSRALCLELDLEDRLLDVDRQPLRELRASPPHPWHKTPLQATQRYCRCAQPCCSSAAGLETPSTPCPRKLVGAGLPTEMGYTALNTHQTCGLPSPHCLSPLPNQRLSSCTCSGSAAFPPAAGRGESPRAATPQPPFAAPAGRPVAGRDSALAPRSEAPGRPGRA